MPKKNLLAFALLGLFALFWAWFLLPEAGYSGFDANDLWPHGDYVRAFREAMAQGSAGIDRWREESCLGAPVFRTYQSLAYTLTAVGGLLLHLPDRRVLHLFIALLLATQGFFFYLTARLWEFPRREALAAAFLSPLVVSDSPMGHEFSSYLFEGYGLYSQLVGLFPLLLVLGFLPRMARWTAGRARPAEIGLWLALTFLCHQFFGVMAGLALFLVLGLGLLERRVTLKQACSGLLVVGSVFLLLTAYQWLSILQDGALMHHSAWHLPRRWDGVGAGEAARLLFGGRLLDAGGLPVLSALALTGLVLALRTGSPRGSRMALVLLGLGLLFFAGKKSFPFLAALPGAENIHFERFLFLVHLGAIFLAASALGWVLRRPRKWKAAYFLALFAVALGLEMRVLARLDYLRRDGRLIAEQESSEARFDRSLFSALAPELERGSLWAGTLREQALPRLAAVPYFAVAAQMGFAQLSISTHSMTYGSDMPMLFDWHNRAHYRIFDVTAVVRPSGEPVPDFLTPAYSTSGVTSYRAPGDGRWGVVGIFGREIAEDEEAYLHAVGSWLRSPMLSPDQVPAIVPRKVAEHWPQALAAISPAGTGSWGKVEKGARLRSGDYRATLFAERVGAYGLLRTAYHPRWEITVNGARVPAHWVAPGFTAFALSPGRNEVRVHFPEDPWRSLLYHCDLAALWLGLLFLYRPKQVLTRLRACALFPSRPKYTEAT